MASKPWKRRRAGIRLWCNTRMEASASAWSSAWAQVSSWFWQRPINHCVPDGWPAKVEVRLKRSLECPLTAFLQLAQLCWLNLFGPDLRRAPLIPIRSDSAAPFLSCAKICDAITSLPKAGTRFSGRPQTPHSGLKTTLRPAQNHLRGNENSSLHRRRQSHKLRPNFPANGMVSGEIPEFGGWLGPFHETPLAG
jgi:hypothetical protein